jgi:hypothetical protein
MYEHMEAARQVHGPPFYVRELETAVRTWDAIRDKCRLVRLLQWLGWMVVRRRCVTAMCFVCALTWGCGDYEIPLRNGYLVARVSSGEFALVAPDHHVVIAPTITGLHVYGSAVVGNTNRHDDFFIVDMRSGRSETRLTEREWRTRLRARGIVSPHLNKTQPITTADAIDVFRLVLDQAKNLTPNQPGRRTPACCRYGWQFRRTVRSHRRVRTQSEDRCLAYRRATFVLGTTF